MTLTLIVQVALELRYGTFFSSVETTDLILQPRPGANKSIIKSLFSMKEEEKLHQLPTPFQVNF